MTVPKTTIPARLSDSLRQLALDLRGALASPPLGSPGPQHRPTGQGQGDVSFAPDDVAEWIIDGWFGKEAQLGPISLLTEDRGWRHGGPAPSDSGWKALDSFDHGGPRVTIDPVDGTRPFLHGLRSAWTVIAAAPEGGGIPWMRDVAWSCVSEIPCRPGQTAILLEANKGRGCSQTETPPNGAISSSSTPTTAPCSTPDRAAVDFAFFSFFAYHPAIRAAVDGLAWQFFERLQRFEGADIAHCYDDQYIASGGQLALLALGRYAMVCDPRPRVMNGSGSMTQCAKPYDLAGAVLCAREAGCRVLDLDGQELDMPMDAETPVGWLGFPGPKSTARLLPHWASVSMD